MSLFFSKNGRSVPPHSIVFCCCFLSNRCAIYKWLHRVAFAQHADISIRFVSPGNIDLYLDNNSHLSLESCEFRFSLFFCSFFFFCFLFCVPISHRYEIGFSKCGGVWKFRNPLNLGRVRHQILTEFSCALRNCVNANASFCFDTEQTLRTKVAGGTKYVVYHKLGYVRTSCVMHVADFLAAECTGTSMQSKLRTSEIVVKFIVHGSDKLVETHETTSTFYDVSAKKVASIGHKILQQKTRMVLG